MSKLVSSHAYFGLTKRFWNQLWEVSLNSNNNATPNSAPDEINTNSQPLANDIALKSSKYLTMRWNEVSNKQLNNISELIINSKLSMDGKSKLMNSIYNIIII